MEVDAPSGKRAVSTSSITEVRRRGAQRKEEGQEAKRRRLIEAELPLEIQAVNPPAVGGWWTPTPRAAGVEDPVKGEVEWFAAEVDLDILPCVLASDKGGPHAAGTSSMTIELLAHLVLIDLRTRDREAAGSQVAGGIIGDIDSLGTAYAVAKLYTRRAGREHHPTHGGNVCGSRGMAFHVVGQT